MESADVGGAVAEEADRDILVAFVLRAPGGAAGDGDVRADDGVGAHDAVLDRGQMHGAAFAAQQAVVAAHQFAEHAIHRNAARERVGVAAIGAEGQIARFHGGGETGGDRFLAERKMAGAFDQVLQKEIVGALLGFAQFDLHAVHAQAQFFGEIVTLRRSG